MTGAPSTAKPSALVSETHTTHPSTRSTGALSATRGFLIVTSVGWRHSCRILTDIRAVALVKGLDPPTGRRLRADTLRSDANSD